MNIQSWFPLGLTGLISLCPRDSQESSFHNYTIYYKILVHEVMETVLQSAEYKLGTQEDLTTGRAGS